MTREQIIKVLDRKQLRLPGFTLRFRNGACIRAVRTSTDAIRGFSAPILCIADRISANELQYKK